MVIGAISLSSKLGKATNNATDSVQKVGDDHSKGDELEFFEFGIRIYKKFNFYCGDGELSCITDMNGSVIVPEGAELLALKKDYFIGRYEGSVLVKEGSTVKKLDKLLFSFQKSGLIEYYLPSEDPNFIGKKVVGIVEFN